MDKEDREKAQMRVIDLKLEIQELETSISQIELEASGSAPPQYLTGQHLQMLNCAAAALNPEDCQMFRSLLEKVNKVVDHNLTSWGQAALTPAPVSRKLDVVEEAQRELDKAFEEAKERNSPSAAPVSSETATASDVAADVRMTPSRRRAHSLGGSPVREFRFKSSSRSSLVTYSLATSSLVLFNNISILFNSLAFCLML